jgi:hypothetical protein
MSWPLILLVCTLLKFTIACFDRILFRHIICPFVSGLILAFVLQSPPTLWKWFHWIDKKQPDWARREIEDKHRRAWAGFSEEERHKKIVGNDKVERERHIQKLKAKQAQNHEVNQKRMDDETVCRYAEEEVRMETCEAKMKRLRKKS